jgi:hypothetical protein
LTGYAIVVRVNNYKTSRAAGFRTDVTFSPFFGSSIRKTADELKRDGVILCMCKLPDAKPIESEWHRKNGKDIGVDFRPHYRRRKDWWFCDTYVPTVDEFMVIVRCSWSAHANIRLRGHLRCSDVQSAQSCS